MSNPEVIVIGAGAAGVGAGLKLQELGVPFVILEAAHRVGGRAFADRSSLPGEWEQGCAWFHSAHINPLLAWADRLGAVYETKDRFDDLLAWEQGKWLDEAARQSMLATLSTSYYAICQSAEDGVDRRISDAVPDAGRWARYVRHVLQLLQTRDGRPPSGDDRGRDRQYRLRGRGFFAAFSDHSTWGMDQWARRRARSSGASCAMRSPRVCASKPQRFHDSGAKIPDQRIRYGRQSPRLANGHFAVGPARPP